MRTLLMLLMIHICIAGHAQEVLSSAGEHIETDAGSASWTIGEPICQTLEGEGGIVTQGFHQPLDLAAIPTLGQWGIILCGLVLMIIGIVVIRQTSPLQPFKHPNEL
jgi:hypothetical protein